MVARAGIGTALQAKPDYAAQPIQQIRREAKRNRDQLGDIRVRQQKALKAANEDISAVDKEVHPVYNPAVENIKENFYKNVGELKKRKPLNWANTTEFTKEKNKLLQGLNYLKQSTENIKSEREQAQKDPDRVLDPDFQQALKNQDLQKVQELTGNKYGYYGGGRMRTIRDAGKAFSDAAEQAGGLTKVGTSIKPSEFGQLQKTSVKELPEEEFKNQLAATYDQYESDWKEMGFGSKEDFIKQGYESVRKQAIDQDYKNMPDQDGDGGGGGRGGREYLFTGMKRGFNEMRPQLQEQIRQGQLTGDQVMPSLGQQFGLPKKQDEQGVPFLEWQTGDFTGGYDQIQGNQLMDVRQKDGKHEFARPSKVSKETSYPVEKMGAEVVMGRRKGDGGFEVYNEEDMNDSEKMENAQFLVRQKLRPVTNTKIEDLTKKGKTLKESVGGEYAYTVYPLGERGVSNKLDEIVNIEEQSLYGGLRYNTPQQRQEQPEQEPATPDWVDETAGGGEEPPNNNQRPSLLPK